MSNRSDRIARARPNREPVSVAPILPERRSGRDTAWGFFLGYLVLISAGFAALCLPGTMVHGNELNIDRAVFTAINAATLTGFQLNVGTGQFNPASPVGPAAILLLTLGGAVFSLAVGGLAVVRILRLPYTDGQVISAATTATTISTLAGAAALLGGGRGLFDALLQSASAFGNSGLYSGTLSGARGWPTHVILLPLALFGGLGLTVLMELYDWVVRRRPLSRHADGSDAVGRDLHRRVRCPTGVAGLLLVQPVCRHRSARLVPSTERGHSQRDRLQLHPGNQQPNGRLPLRICGSPSPGHTVAGDGIDGDRRQPGQHRRRSQDHHIC